MYNYDLLSFSHFINLILLFFHEKYCIKKVTSKRKILRFNNFQNERILNFFHDGIEYLAYIHCVHRVAFF